MAVASSARKTSQARGSQSNKRFAEKTPDACPQTIIWQLSPATSIGHGSVVKDTAKHIHEDGDQENDAKDGSGPNTARFVWLRVSASMNGPCLEEV